MKEPLKTGFEYDAILGRRWFCFTQKAGVCKKAKRQINRRQRRKGKEELDKDWS